MADYFDPFANSLLVNMLLHEANAMTMTMTMNMKQKPHAKHFSIFHYRIWEGEWKFTPWYMRWFFKAHELRRAVYAHTIFGWVYIWEYRT